MSGLYNPNFSPSRAQIRSTSDVDRLFFFISFFTYAFLSFLLQPLLVGVDSRASKAWTFLPICSRLLNQDNSLVAAISTSYNFTHTGKMGGPPAMAMEWQGHVAGLHQEAAIARLALLNSNLREESPGPSGSVSPFNSNAMKRPKTGR